MATLTPSHRRLAYSGLGILAALLLAVGVNLLVERLLPRVRVDLTDQRLFTLSDGTRQLLGGLRDPVTLKLFYSRRLGAEIPSYGAYADRVREILNEYVANSSGRLRLEVLDPEPFSETEDRALGYGLQGVPLDQNGEQVYFGLVASNLVDEERTIAFFQPERERFLEYDLTRLIWELSSPRRPVLGVMSSLPLNGDPRMMMMMRAQGSGPWVVMQQLRQFFTVKDVALDVQVVDADVQVLLVAHAQHLSEAAQYAIDQFVMRGGKLVVLVDPMSESQASRPNPMTGQPATDTASELDRLLNAWGVETPHDQVMLDLRGAWRVRAPGAERVQAVDYIAWFNLTGDSISRAEVATAQLEQVTLASAGEVRRRTGANVEFTPLLTSSAQSAPAEVAAVKNDPNPVRLLAGFRADGQRRVLMARIRGQLRSAFDAPPAPAEGQTRPDDFPAHRAETQGPANLVVANDSDLLEDRFWVRVQDFFGQQVATPISNNGALVANLVDTLAGSDALITLRSRGDSQKPFELVEDIRRRADAQYRQTERQLQQRLEDTEKRLRELRQGSQPQAGERNQAQAVITPEQRAEIDRARAEIVATRRRLRAVQLELRREIEGVETWLKILNIALVPLLLTGFAVGLAVVRQRRRAAARA